MLGRFGRPQHRLLSRFASDTPELSEITMEKTRLFVPPGDRGSCRSAAGYPFNRSCCHSHRLDSSEWPNRLISLVCLMYAGARKSQLFLAKSFSLKLFVQNFNSSNVGGTSKAPENFWLHKLFGQKVVGNNC